MQEFNLVRSAQAAPTKPGWYYACNRHGGETMPVEVVLDRGRFDVYEAGIRGANPVTNYVWFGPVPGIKEE